MISKGARRAAGNSIAVVLDKPLLEELGLDEDAEVEVSTNGPVIVITPKRSAARDLLSLHAEQIRLFGGSSGIRDLGLLESAMGTVEATFDGAFLHETLFSK